MRIDGLYERMESAVTESRSSNEFLIGQRVACRQRRSEHKCSSLLRAGGAALAGDALFLKMARAGKRCHFDFVTSKGKTEN